MAIKDGDTLTLTLGEEATLKCAKDASGTSVGTTVTPNLKWYVDSKSAGEFVDVTQNPPLTSELTKLDTVKLAALQPGTPSFKLTCSILDPTKDPPTTTTAFTIHVIVSTPQIKIIRSDTSMPITALTMFTGVKVKVTPSLTDVNGAAILVRNSSGQRVPWSLTLKPDPINVDVSPVDPTQQTFASGTTLTITAKKAVAATQITISGAGVSQVLPIVVKPATLQVVDQQGKVISTLNLKEGDQPLPLNVQAIDDTGMQLPPRPLSHLHFPPPIAGNGNIVTIDTASGKVTAGHIAGTATFQVTDDEGDNPATVTVNVATLAKLLSLQLPPSSVVSLNQTVPVSFTVKDSNGVPIPDSQTVHVDATATPAGSATVQVVGRTINITPKTLGDIHITVTLKDDNGMVLQTIPFDLTAPNITGFRTVKVALDMMDDRTAGFLFGSETAKDFHVMRVRLFNNLRADDGTFQGDSILAYSESIEVRVSLDKRYDPSARSDVADRSSIWKPVTDTDITSRFTLARANDENPFPGSIQRYRILTGTAFGTADRVHSIETMRLGGAQIQLFVSYDGRQVQNAAWESNKPDVATVDNSGKVTAVSVGIAKITARLTGPNETAQVSATIAVFDAPGGHTLDPRPLPMLVNSTQTFKLLDNNKRKVRSKDIVWHTEDHHIATVVGGVVTAKLSGVTQLKASRPGGADYSIRMPILVSDPSQAPGGVPSVFYDNGELDYLRHRFLYRPYSYEIMVNTLDQRENGSPTSVAFSVLNAVLSFASFLNSVNALKGSETPLVLDKTGNILIPGLKSLFPNLRETQRQNFVSLTMRPIEEIPFGSDVARVIFIPKRAISGMLRGYQVRISEVDTSYFNITVAIVKKNTTQSGNAVPAATPGQ